MRFPRVPPNPFSSVDAADAARSLEDIAKWRAAFVTWLRGPHPEGMSRPLVAVLLEVLGAESTSTYLRYPYRLSRFPVRLEAVDAVADLQAVLLWRAGVVDFLADVWDTVDGEIGTEECGELEALLLPAGMTGVCPLCLASVADAAHFESCAVQNAWARG